MNKGFKVSDSKPVSLNCEEGNYRCHWPLHKIVRPTKWQTARQGICSSRIGCMMLGHPAVARMTAFGRNLCNSSSTRRWSKADQSIGSIPGWSSPWLTLDWLVKQTHCSLISSQWISSHWQIQSPSHWQVESISHWQVKSISHLQVKPIQSLTNLPTRNFWLQWWLAHHLSVERPASWHVCPLWAASARSSNHFWKLLGVSFHWWSQ